MSYAGGAWNPPVFDGGGGVSGARIYDVVIKVNGERVDRVSIGDNVTVDVVVSVNSSGRYRVCLQVIAIGRGRPCVDLVGEKGRMYVARFSWVEKGPEGKYSIRVWLYDADNSVLLQQTVVPYYVIKKEVSEGEFEIVVEKWEPKYPVPGDKVTFTVVVKPREPSNKDIRVSAVMAVSDNKNDVCSEDKIVKRHTGVIWAGQEGTMFKFEYTFYTSSYVCFGVKKLGEYTAHPTH